MTDTSPLPAIVITHVRDQATRTILCELTGAVVLPRATPIELPDGTTARVETLRMVAPTTTDNRAHLILDVSHVPHTNPRA